MLALVYQCASMAGAPHCSLAISLMLTEEQRSLDMGHAVNSGHRHVQGRCLLFSSWAA